MGSGVDNVGSPVESRDHTGGLLDCARLVSAPERRGSGREWGTTVAAGDADGRSLVDIVKW